MELVEILSDPDKNGVFKISNKDTQVFKVVATNGTETVTKTFSLSGLTLQEQPTPPGPTPTGSNLIICETNESLNTAFGNPRGVPANITCSQTVGTFYDDLDLSTPAVAGAGEISGSCTSGFFTANNIGGESVTFKGGFLGMKIKDDVASSYENGYTVIFNVKNTNNETVFSNNIDNTTIEGFNVNGYMSAFIPIDKGLVNGNVINDVGTIAELEVKFTGTDGNWNRTEYTIRYAIGGLTIL